MAQLITITPKKGSFKFNTVGSGISQYNKDVASSDPLAVVSAGEYKGERFPNSRQKHRVMWSYTQRRWKLAGCTKNSEALNDLVKECRIKYPKDHPSYPNYIEKADIFDADDPFFKQFKFTLREGSGVLDKDHPRDKIIIMALQANRQFALGTDSAVSPRAKHIITDKNRDKKEKKNQRAKNIQAITLYNNLAKDKKVRIAMAMGLIMKENTEEDIVDELLYAAAVDENTTVRKGVTRQDYFIAMCMTSTEEINIRYLIQKAKGAGILKLTQDQGYVLFGQSVGMNENDIYKYFKNPENAKMIIRLQTLFDKENVVEDEELLINEKPLNK